MKDMGETSYVIGIKIHRKRSRGILSLSEETYINKVLERFNMKDCSPSIAPLVKGDKLALSQCLKNDCEVGDEDEDEEENVLRERKEEKK